MGSSAATCGIQFPEQGLKLGPLHWKHGVLDTGPPGYSLHDFFFLQKALFSQNLTWKADTDNRSSLNFPLGGRMKNLHANPFGSPLSCLTHYPVSPCIHKHKVLWTQRWETTDFVFQNLSLIISKLGMIILIRIKRVYHQKISQLQH